VKTLDHRTDEATLRAAFGAARTSPQRLAIARAAQGMCGAFTVDELHRAATRAMRGIGVATTYRAVAAMLASGALVLIGERDGGTLYAWCAKDEHHHHVVCTRCGAVAGIDCPLPEDRIPRAVEAAGYRITRHELTLYGICPRCHEAGDT